MVRLSPVALVSSCGGPTVPVLLLGGLLEASSGALLVLVSVCGMFCLVFLHDQLVRGFPQHFVSFGRVAYI